MTNFATRFRAAWSLLLLGIIAVPLFTATLHAQTLRIGVQADAGTMDPQAQNIQTTLTLHSMVYEALVSRDRQLRLAPALATSWELVNATTWRFHLRPNVKFHDGTAFTAADVKFSVERAKDQISQFQVFVATIQEVRVVDDLTVEFVTTGPDPLLPDKLTYVFIMSKAWAEQHNAARPQNLVNRQETFTALNANGTGPFVLRSREPDSRTILERNPNYWGPIDSNVARVEWRPIGSDPTRIAALISGDLDIVIDVPTQDVARLASAPGLKIERTDEFRTIFFGFDLKNDQLRYGQPGVGNPFRDRRVREAVYRAVDIEAIQRTVMRGLATPTGQLLAPGNVGYDRALDTRLPYDPAAARRLLAEAGYPNGFAFTLDCPNDRYVNDEQVCRALTAMLTQVGLNVTLNLMPRARYFPKIWERDTSMFMMGFNSPYFDGMYALETLYMTRNDPEGVFNYGLYSNAEVDRMIRAARDETDLRRREEMMRAAWHRLTEDMIYIPMYNQVLVWAMRRNVDAVLRPDNWFEIRWARVN
jgi:peptide/nickel transport system substrate-binding protein